MLLLRLSWAYRNLKVRRQLFLLSPAVIALFLLIGFTVAGAFSSLISSAVGDTVLLTSKNCGFIVEPTDFTEGLNDVDPYNAKRINSALNYAQQCYSDNQSGMVECNRFVVPGLPTVIANQSAECPFDSRVCRSESNMRLDSGYIDSDSHLGLNTPLEQRSSWRVTLHCAPLVTEGFQTIALIGNQTLIRYHYGDSMSVENGTELNYTYEVENLHPKHPGAEDGTLNLKDFEL